MDSIIHVHNLRFHNSDFLFTQPIQLIALPINRPIRGLDLPLHGLFPDAFSMRFFRGREVLARVILTQVLLECFNQFADIFRCGHSWFIPLAGFTHMGSV